MDEGIFRSVKTGVNNYTKYRIKRLFSLLGWFLGNFTCQFSGRTATFFLSLDGKYGQKEKNTCFPGSIILVKARGDLHFAPRMYQADW